MGNVTKTTDAKGNTVSETVYSCLNQPLTVTDAMGKATTYTYNALGKVEAMKDALGQTKTYRYNAMGQPVEVIENGRSSIAAYDALGNLTHLNGPLGGSTQYVYDSMGKMTEKRTTSGGTVRYGYNALHLKNEIVNARGERREVTYDAKGRVTGYTAPEGAVSYTYDANDNVLTVTDQNGTVARTYDALNRVTSYTDTYGKVIRYEYDAVGNLTKLIYPDNTAVTYAYDANRNLTRVTDWAGRVTTYTYDENNRMIAATKPDGSVTAVTYDNAGRMTAYTESVDDTVISGFEYTYDDLSRIVEETVLAKDRKMCYTYDEQSRVTSRAEKTLHDTVLHTDRFTYDAAGNLTGGTTDDTFTYDTNNRLVQFNDTAVSYDLDGNMIACGDNSLSFDSANRLISAGGHTYTYNAEDVRIRNLCEGEDTTYTYDTNCSLSKLLCKTTGGVTTKYIYGRGLIGEETNNSFKTYHFDYRGSTVAITDESGNVTDTFAYDTYGKQIEHDGNSDVIFGYNGRDGVVTDDNGLIYMRARYYSPDMRRFVNADIVAGELSHAVTLNRYAYANGNPVSNVDPFGLSAERGNSNWYGATSYQATTVVTLDYEEDLTFGHNILTVSHTQTLTTIQHQHGTAGTWFGAYAYTNKLINGNDSNVSAGLGIDFLYVLGLDINVKWLGIEASIQVNIDNYSFYASLDINLRGDTSASIGIINELENGTEVNDQFSINGDTGTVLMVVALLMGVGQII